MLFSGCFYNQCCALLTNENQREGPVFTSKTKYGCFVQSARIFVGVVGLLFYIYALCLVLQAVDMPTSHSEIKDAFKFFLNLGPVGLSFLIPLGLSPYRYELYSDGTVSVLTPLKRWNFKGCVSACRWVDGGPPGVAFRPTIKFAMDSDNCILILRRDERHFLLTISPYDPEGFIQAIASLQEATEDLAAASRHYIDAAPQVDDRVAMMVVPV